MYMKATIEMCQMLKYQNEKLKQENKILKTKVDLLSGKKIIKKKTILIMDYEGVKKKVEFDNFDNVVRLEIKVVSGDELISILYIDYSVEIFDSSTTRGIDYFDCNYCIYDITKNIDDIDNWSKRTSSYDFNYKKITDIKNDKI